jgi:hypothetical protein
MPFAAFMKEIQHSQLDRHKRHGEARKLTSDSPYESLLQTITSRAAYGAPPPQCVSCVGCRFLAKYVQ